MNLRSLTLRLCAFVPLCLCALSPPPADAATYYVRKGGSDSADGSSATPWLTINKAIDTAAADDVINVGSGTYNEGTGTWTIDNVFNRFITIQSETGSASDVTISTSAGSGYGILINGVTYESDDATPLSVDYTTDTFTRTTHGWADGTIVRAGSSVNLPAPLTRNTLYWVRDSAANTFKLAAVSGGAAIDLTDNGTGVIAVYRAAGYIKFRNVSFVNFNNTQPISTLGTCDHLVWDSCKFTNLLPTSSGCFGQYSAGAFITSLTWLNCQVNQTGSAAVSGISLSTLAHSPNYYLNDISILDSTVRTVGDCVVLRGVTNLRVSGCKLQSDNPSSASHVLLLGDDGNRTTAYITSGVVEDNVIASRFSHNVAIGASCQDLLVARNTISGGYYGVVLKACGASGFPVYFVNNTIRDGAAYAIYLKGGQYCTVTGNDVYNRTAGTAVSCVWNGAGQNWGYSTVSSNYLRCGAAATALSIDSNEDITQYKTDDGTPLSIDYTTDTFTRNGHGRGDGTVVDFSSTLTLPTPLSASAVYYVINATANTFKVSATPAGSAVNLTDNGTGVISVFARSVFDYNCYEFDAAPAWGIVKGTTVTGLASLLTAWNGYGGGTNEDNASDTSFGPYWLTALKALPASPTSGSIGAVVKTNLDATVGSRSTYAGGAVASVIGDVGGKIIGAGAGTITGTGARVVDASGNAVAPAGDVSAILGHTTILDSMWELDEGQQRFLAKALELTPANPSAATIAGAVLDEPAGSHTGIVASALSTNYYSAQINLTRTTGVGAKDSYDVEWLKNAAPLTTGITAVGLYVMKRDGTDRIGTAGSPVTMTEVGTTGVFIYDTTTSGQRLATGEAALATVTSTIDGQTRTWRRWVGRDK